MSGMFIHVSTIAHHKNSIPNRSSQTYSIQLKTLQTSINVARIDIEISTSLSSSTLFQQIKY